MQSNCQGCIDVCFFSTIFKAVFLYSSTTITFHSIVFWDSSVHILVDLDLLHTTQGFLYADPLNHSTDTLLCLLLVLIMRLGKMLLQTSPSCSSTTSLGPEPAPNCAFSECCCSIAGNHLLQLQEQHIHKSNKLPTNLTNN